jgi:monothiol glutaredoxin
MSNPFQVIAGTAVEETNPSLPMNERIQNLINSSSIFLFMKGTPQMPMCGFSANVVRILDSLGASYNTFNILSDGELREGIKQFSNWPTYPQLYFKGQLIGGNDIVTEMLNNGELKTLLKQ